MLHVKLHSSEFFIPFIFPSWAYSHSGRKKFEGKNVPPPPSTFNYPPVCFFSAAERTLHLISVSQAFLLYVVLSSCVNKGLNTPKGYSNKN